MAMFPCTVGPHRFPGKASTLYVALLGKVSANRWKLRLCPGHTKFVRDGLKPYQVTDESVDGDGQVAMRRCPSCDQPIQQDGQQLYVTAYLVNEERSDYWALVHDNCSAPAWLPYTEELAQPVR